MSFVMNSGFGVTPSSNKKAGKLPWVFLHFKFFSLENEQPAAPSGKAISIPKSFYLKKSV
jgi:hypothetical protein